MKKALLLLAVLIVLLAAVIAIKPENSENHANADVIVTTFALYDIARHLLNGAAEVQMLIPFGKEVHTFEPTPSDMIRVQDAALFLYSGAGLEPWAETLAAKAKAVDMSQYVALYHLEEGHEEAHAEHHHDHESADPHYWLDIDNMIALTNALARRFEKAFSSLPPEKIEQNRLQYIARLKQLDALYKRRLSTCRLQTIVVGHDAFGYLARRYGFEVKALTGLSPDMMPDAKTMARLSDLIKSRKIPVVFYEAYVSDKLSQAIAAETGARVEVLQPLATIASDEIGMDYFRLMNVNLLKLHDALECQ